MNRNLIIDTDSYKSSHWLQYPPGTTNLFNYLESRGGKYSKTVFFGLQYILKEYLSKPFTGEDVSEAAGFFKAHGLPFNLEGWNRLLKVHGGYLPLRIKAVDEGSIIPTSLPLMTCEATDPEFFWLVGWFETMLMRLWYPITVATQSYHIKQLISKYLNETADDVSGLPFKLHDFGSRGVSSRESAAIGGASHLVNFMGSDTVAGVVMANETYGAGMAGFSIPASEHSTITSWGQENEVDAYRNMLKQFGKPGAIFACVSDSYDVYKACEDLWGEKLRQEIIDSGAVVVVRPDSGDPVFVVNTLLHTLERKFGSKVNSKGYRLLNHVRVIQGDGINDATIDSILKSAKLAGFSTDNIAFGMGGALLQQVNRDTQRFAYKCSSIQKLDDPESKACVVTVKWHDVFKDPVDDKGKRSKRGRIGLKLDPKLSSSTQGSYAVCADEDPENLLKVRFENGNLLNQTTFAEVRERAK